MSRTNSKAPIFAFTNYPIEGSPSGDVVKVEVLTYDRNKYALVRYQGHIDEVKVGYLKRHPRVDKPLSRMSLALLPSTLEEPRRSRQKAQQEVSCARKKSKTSYCIVYQPDKVGRKVVEANSLTDALKTFKAFGNDAQLYRDARRGYSFRTEPLLEMRDGFLTIFVAGHRPLLKSRHLRKAGI